jgi:hypothetical protein
MRGDWVKKPFHDPKGGGDNVMMEILTSRRITVRALQLILLVSALFIGQAAWTQTPPSGNTPKLTYTKSTLFQLPVQMDDATRATLREVCLYVKAGTNDWVRQETGLPSMPHFTYKVPRDGEYWFTLVTIDKNGKMTPSDLNREAPGLRVMVDTQNPVIDVQPWTSPEGDFCLRCQVQDANPDPRSLKASYRDQAGEHTLEPLPGQPNVFKVVGREVLNQPLRVIASDLCGNTTSREVNVKDMVMATLQSNKTNAPKVVPTSTATYTPPPLPSLPVDTAKNEVSKPALPCVPSLPEKAQSYTTMPTPPAPSQTGNAGMAPPSVVPTLPSVPQTPMPTPARDVTMAQSIAPQTPVLPPNATMPANNVLPPVPGVAPSNIAPSNVMPGNVVPTNLVVPAAPNTSPKQILNSTHATIDYRIDQVGPSGVGKVEVYLTGDGGLNWQRLQEDADRRSPAEIELPGEGLFGVRLVVTNGNGFGGTPPARGEQPTCWIEVDTTAPFIQLRPIDPAQNGVMELRWTASDKNLGPEPIHLYYRTRQDGQWQVIARNVKNEGLYRWTFPRDQGSQFWVKVEVADMAGNTAQAETPNAIVLDITEPHASVVGVTGMVQRVTPPSGN